MATHEEIDQRVVEAYRRLSVGGTPPSIAMVADEIGLSRRTTGRIMQRLGLRSVPKGRPCALSDDEARMVLVEWLTSDISFRALGRRLGVTFGAVQAAIRRVNGGEIPQRVRPIVEVELEPVRPSKNVRPCMKCDRHIRGRYLCKACREANAKLSGSLI